MTIIQIGTVLLKILELLLGLVPMIRSMSIATHALSTNFFHLSTVNWNGEIMLLLAVFHMPLQAVPVLYYRFLQVEF